ncbi:Uncharacterized protein Rs2_00170 [Raphanus sativus]|uniref:Uncharacterized protein LOC108811489 n=1 Tax=Raphanus sativus TaxID=3726 RepID=A0A6J0JVD6_RAPSA|nr:uncharacterized protein LOC108811489 [Raphanus sativus]KAJ4914620.1 Uncharacterized protein Rs2_00170 [Raphanus sativus]
MGSVVKAYCQYKMPSSSFHHYYRPSNPISLFAITSPSISPSDPSSPSNSNGFKIQFGGHLIIPAVAVAASAWFFLRLHRYPPIITAPVDLELEEEGAVKELPLKHKPGGHVKALHFYKTKPGTVFKLIQLYSSDGNYESLKARIRLSAEWLERARRELEEVVERDPGRVMEYSQVVDELMDLLRDMEVYVDQCEKDKVKGYLTSCNRLLARVRKMEARILNALKHFHDDDDDDDDETGGHN